MRLLLTCPQGQVSGEKGRRHLLTRPWGGISATPHKTWVFPLTCPSSFLRPWGNFWLALSVTAAPCQRLGCRLGRPLGNVPPGRSGPRRGSQVGAPPKACAKPSLASPFGGRWCPVGTVQRLVSAAASVGDGRSPLGCITRAGRRECPPREGREGKPLARSPASGKLPSRCAAVRERRGEAPVSLAFSHPLRAYKGKVVGLWSHLPVRSAQGVCHRQTAPYNPQAF